MTLSDPRDAYADQSGFIDYLMGLAALAHVVDDLAADDGQARVPDDFVYALLGLASTGAMVYGIAECVAGAENRRSQSFSADARWLR